MNNVTPNECKYEYNYNAIEVNDDDFFNNISQFLMNAEKAYPEYAKVGALLIKIGPNVKLPKKMSIAKNWHVDPSEFSVYQSSQFPGTFYRKSLDLETSRMSYGSYLDLPQNKKNLPTDNIDSAENASWQHFAEASSTKPLTIHYLTDKDKNIAPPDLGEALSSYKKVSDDEIPGITSIFYYFSIFLSIFFCHVEDSLLNSMNVNYSGEFQIKKCIYARGKKMYLCQVRQRYGM